MLPFLKAYFFSYIEKALAKIDEEEGSLVQKLNAKLSFLSTLKSSFRAKFSGEWAHQFYFDHSSALNEVAGFDSEGECPQSYFALFNAFEAVGNKDRKAVTLALTLDKFSSTQVVCDNREIFSTEQVDGLNYRINLGQQNLFYDQLKAELHLPEKYLGAHVKALMESEERFNLKPIHREMYLYANYIANALNSKRPQAIQLLRSSYDHLYSLINSDIATFLNQHKRMDVAKLNQFITKQCLKYQTVLESTMISSLLITDFSTLRADRETWLANNTDSTMQVALINSMTGELIRARDSFIGIALDRPKMIQRLSALQELTKERLMRYKTDYKQENPAELVRAVIGDYARGLWRWGSHFRRQGQGFLHEYRKLLNKREVTVEDQQTLLNAVQRLQRDVRMSQAFSLSSSFSIRLAFLEGKLAKQLSARFSEDVTEIIKKLRGAKTYERSRNILQEVHALKARVLSMESGDYLFSVLSRDLQVVESTAIRQIKIGLDKAIVDIENKFKQVATCEDKRNVLNDIDALKKTLSQVEVEPDLLQRLEHLTAQVGQFQPVLDKVITKESVQGVKTENAREALMVHAVLGQQAAQAESVSGYNL
ncbi:hypothetical protein [Piscirickettsia salmonis]|nr:hypothetical protein [Piscirickettsia salmonis]APS56695.1 hypothetical protein AVI52_05180 [Piscirickettsia salmonis]ERL61271.1 hypothetical protein K661_02387 [Piscirickettsia salmonis LF-89 = ATCC VR-1361]PEQ16117.1 hypothetical protein X973_09145 [Piscirickettsia salmonis]QGN78043.1 hypothetical protein Psal001_02263 [Piscirickettsia salmonis]QGN81625.1 hypothetical protein Psal002_02280 [Piscirickettsia salmonis]